MRRLALVVCALAAVRCGSKRTVTPTSPVFEDPAVACPSDVAVFEHNGVRPTVSFDAPVPSKGSPPFTVLCAPSSGSTFSAGVTTVACEATDTRTYKATCSFNVTVTPIPHLSISSILALGDSLTEGKHSAVATILKVPTASQYPVPGSPTGGIYNESGSYAELLDAKLAARYQDQTITLTTFGLGLEKAQVGELRLKQNWNQFQSDVVLLFEGVNDLTGPETATVAGMNAGMDAVIDALDDDIGFVQARGRQAFVATLLPLRAPIGQNAVDAIGVVNERIRKLAALRNATLVDLNAVVPASLIGSDGIHPAAGSDAYSRIADAWMKAMAQKFEVIPPEQP